MIGAVVDGKYEIRKLIGEGGMGAVYEAHSNSTGRDVAIKLISNESVAQDEVLKARFEREAQAAAKVRSPHIVEILDAGHDSTTGHPYMVMERLVGENMLHVLRRLGPLPVELAVRVGIQTSLGLHKAHEAGVVHRDIKPANLFLSEDGDGLVLKLLDFGVAKVKMDQATDSANESLTRTGSMLGSPMYMSPEQARGLKTIDHRADIWSLGIVLYQLLTGKTPHAGIDGLGELIITICSEEPEPLNLRAAWVPTKLAEVVQGSLKLASNARYQDAHEFAKALMTCLSDPTDYGLREEMLVALTDAEKAASPQELGAAEQPAAEPQVQPAGSPAAQVEAPNEATVALDDIALFPADNRASPATPSEDAATIMLDPEESQAAVALAAGPKSAWATKAKPPEDEADPEAGERAKDAESPLEKTAPNVRSANLDKKAAASVKDAPDSSRAVVGVVVIGLLVGAAGLYYYFTGPGAGPPTVPTASTTASATAGAGQSASQPTTRSAAVAASPTQSATADSATASSSSSQTAATGAGKVKIVPAFASVTLDGKRATITDGFITIDGELNSTHNVVVMVGGKRKVVTITITADGPVPHEIVFLSGGSKPKLEDPYH